MGRVYKALRKADRWSDRVIGRPARSDGATVPSLDSESTASAGFGFELTEAPSTPLSAGLFNVAQALELQPALYDRVAHTVARRPVVEAPVPGPQPPVFEEPSVTFNVGKLTLSPHLAALAGGDRLSEERYRTLAVKLLNIADRRKLKTLLITSAEAAEGKTTVAINVAWSLAKHAEGRVLLIDANVASESVSPSLGIDAKCGWLNLVDRSCELKQAFIRLDPNGLYVMTPGPSRSSEELASRLDDLMADLAPHFDIILFDCASILDSSETQRLAEVLDGTVLVARAGRTHHAKVTAARKLVRKERRLGVVLNDAEVGAESAPPKHDKKFFGRLFGRKQRRK